MTEPLFTLEERLLVAYLLKHGPRTAADVVEHFGGAAFVGPDRAPLDLTDADCVTALLETLWFENVVEPWPDNRWKLPERLWQLMELASDVGHGGVLAVLHDAKSAAEVRHHG
ncbi:hypothetical protein [Archangium violaceum]|uniref:Uncharacterized protein n=1 Tax=Archangium violaceum Cb vi76 TaxID=1406225 RepID=A0A084SDZ9_9BACT|nr:hypothetical protein [Archangium violaceum]KFA86684.1 hypothetical protein Q664_52670 [Archangium violaceum Cb vi76]